MWNWPVVGKTAKLFGCSTNSRTTMPCGHPFCWIARAKSWLSNPILNERKFGNPFARPLINWHDMQRTPRKLSKKSETFCSVVVSDILEINKYFKFDSVRKFVLPLETLANWLWVQLPLEIGWTDSDGKSICDGNELGVEWKTLFG